jgi:hypothetical protein
MGFCVGMGVRFLCHFASSTRIEFASATALTLAATPSLFNPLKLRSQIRLCAVRGETLRHCHGSVRGP